MTVDQRTLVEVLTYVLRNYVVIPNGIGSATLAAGAVTVTNEAVSTSTLIFISSNAALATGALRAVAGSGSFTITSSDAGASGKVAYLCLQPPP